MLVVMWLNSLRYVFCFDGQETLGSSLFMKLGVLSFGIINTLFQTAYYAASHTGTLNRVIRRVSLSATHLLPKYSFRAKVVTAVCWLYIAWNMFLYVYDVQLFVRGRLGDFSLTKLSRSLPERYLDALKAVFVSVQLLIIGTLAFSQATNFGCAGPS